MSSIKRMLVPTDFSEASRAAVRFATTLARDLSAEIVLVHVIEPHVSYYVSPEASVYLPPADEIRRSAERELEPLLKEVRKSVRARSLLMKGAAFAEILKAAKGQRANLIVIGARGAGPFVSALFGSTASKVIHKASCPVIVHQEPGRAQRGKHPKALRPSPKLRAG